MLLLTGIVDTVGFCSFPAVGADSFRIWTKIEYKMDANAFRVVCVRLTFRFGFLFIFTIDRQICCVRFTKIGRNCFLFSLHLDTVNS